MRKVINLLMLLQLLINLRFQCRATPKYGPIFTLRLVYLPEPVIFKCVSDDLHITFVELEIVTSIRGLKWSDCYRVFIRSKDKKLLLKFSDLGVCNVFIGLLCILYRN